MSMYRRGAVLSTFLGACAAVALSGASLATSHWLEAQATRTRNNESSGVINFGLFEGRKRLNVGYGWRHFNVNVIQWLSAEPDLMSYPLWAATIGCLAGALLFGSISGIFALINTATTPIWDTAGIPGLYVWNSLAMALNASAASLWIAQFYKYLQNNVMSYEERQNNWISENRASFGYSFWLAVAASLVHVVNLITLCVGTRKRRPPGGAAAPVLEEKQNGAIMLY